MRKLRFIIFYITTIGAFAALMYWIVQVGKNLEVGKNIIIPHNDTSHWMEFLKTLSFNLVEPLAILLAQIITIIIVAKILGWGCRKIGQPTVIGEILAGILLGPSFVGMYFPEFTKAIFPIQSLGNLQFLSQIGLILFMFMVGMELNIKTLKNRTHDAVVISHVSIIVPFALGMGLAYFLYLSFAPQGVQFLSHPVEVIISGLKTRQELQFKNSLIRDYKIEQLPTVDLLDLFSDFDEEISCYSFLEGTSLITDIMLLKKLARNYPSCNYLEIGSWRGESIVNVSEVATHCTSITLSPQEMKAMNLSEGIIKLHGLFSKNVENITEILHNSRTFDFSKLEQKFDLIFIDGDHHYEGVLNDTIKTFNLRRDANSVIVWHDYSFTSENVRHSVLKAILDGIPAEKHKNLYHVSNSLCAVYIENASFPTSKTTFPTFPNKKFSVKVKTHKM